LIIIGISIILIIFSSSKIKIDTSIDNLFPKDFAFERAMELSSKVNISNKIILYISANNKNQLEIAIDKSMDILNKYDLKLKSGLPNTNDVQDILKYCEENSLLLYPYENLKNPFTKEEIKDRLQKKIIYIESNPFFYATDSFFLDPLMMGFDVLKFINKDSGRYTPFKDGIISKDQKNYIKIFNADFKNQDYDKVKILYQIDKDLCKMANSNNCISFLYSSHLYFYDSYKSIRLEVFLIFILSIFLTLLVFFIFFKKIDLLVYSFLPIVISFALSFLFIAIFKKSYGGIALAFGATVSGIAIDYTIHYISKASLYKTLSDFRKKNSLSMFLGFLTTIVAFLIIYLFSNIIALKEISLFALISITLSFFFSFFGLQKFLPPAYIESRPILNIRVRNRFSFIIWIIVVLFFVTGFFFVRFEDKILNLDKKHRFLEERIKLIKKNFAESTDSLFIVFEGDSKKELIEQATNALNILYQKNIELGNMSQLIFLPSNTILEKRKIFIKNNFNKEIFYNELRNSYFTIDSFDMWLRNIDNINSLQLSTLPQFLENELKNLFVEWNNKIYLMLFIEDRVKLNKIDSILNEAGIKHFVIDLIKDSGNGILKFEKEAIKLIFVAFIIIFIIILIGIRDIFGAFLIILSPLLSVIAALSTSFYTFRGINIMHIAASVIILGISIDYGIYITLSLIKGKDDQEIILTNRSILASALTTIAGFGALILSSNQAIFSLSTSIISGILMALLTSFVGIPFIFKIIEKIKLKRPSR